MIAIVFAVAVQTPGRARSWWRSPSTPPGARDAAAAGAPRHGQARPAAAGMFLSILVVIIVFLMVMKPF